MLWREEGRPRGGLSTHSQRCPRPAREAHAVRTSSFFLRLLLGGLECPYVLHFRPLFAPSIRGIYSSCLVLCDAMGAQDHDHEHSSHSHRSAQRYKILFHLTRQDDLYPRTSNSTLRPFLSNDCDVFCSPILMSLTIPGKIAKAMRKRERAGSCCTFASVISRCERSRYS